MDAVHETQRRRRTETRGRTGQANKQGIVGRCFGVVLNASADGRGPSAEGSGRMSKRRRG